MSIFKKKKLLIIIAAVIVIICCIAGGLFYFGLNGDKEPSLEEIIDEKLAAYETDLADSLESMETNDDVASYLINWGKNKKINVSQDSSGNVIFSVRAAEENKNGQPCVIICGYDAKNMGEYTEPMAVALTVAKNGQQNCKYKVVFCPEDYGKKTGAENLSADLFSDNPRVFYLGKSGTSKATQVTGGFRQYELYEKLKYTVPDFDKAYKIKIKNVPSEVMGSKMGSKPNPIKTIGNLLANFKSTSMLFEVSSFYGGSSASAIPSSAGITIVINSSDASKFEDKMDKAIEKFMDKYSEDYPEIEYTYEETDMPSNVLTKNETDNIVSLMYTALNGVYNKDDDGNVVAVTNIGKISSKDGMLKIAVAAMSYSSEYLEEITESYRTISGLCNVNYDCTEKKGIYNGDGLGKNVAMMKSFEKAFADFTDGSELKNQKAVEYTPLTVLAEKNENMSLMYIGVTEKTKEKYAGSLVTFMDMGAEDEE